MKTNEIIGVQNIKQGLGAKKNQKNGSFARMLDQVQAKSESSRPQPAKPLGTDPLAYMRNYTTPIESKQVMEQASSLLDVMDDFARGLGDPRKTLKSLEPLVRQMETKIMDLNHSSQGLNDDLSKLANEIAVTAKIETMKFDRGDYI